MNIFVGNLSFEATEGDVKKLFEGFGNVASVKIVMRKEKKAPKSRGFGFVQMLDDQEAQAAIAVLAGKEFMGRPLNVEAARPKTEIRRENELKEKGKKSWLSPVFNKYPALTDRRVRPSGQPGTYKGGRRTRSYRERHGLTGMQEEAKPRRRSQDNPMRWRKKREQPKPWQKSPGERKPWERAGGEARPWKKAEGEFKPWRKSEGGIKPWKKPAGDAKPWKKKEGEFKPWRKRTGESKPWRKKSSKRPRPRQSRIESRRKPGGYTR